MEVWVGSSERKGNVTWITGFWVDHRRLKRDKRRAKLGKAVPRRMWMATAVMSSYQSTSEGKP
jgi:hypothetical protein